MKNNPYDNQQFFDEYETMPRSQFGLDAAGEWETMKKILPSLQNLDVLDLGCGYGWHCAYFANHKANSIKGIDISEKMIEKAKKINNHSSTTYEIGSLDSFDTSHSYDLIFSSLAIHYIDNFSKLSKDVYQSLNQNGTFLFSVEHPIFTAEGSQNWILNKEGIPEYWPVDRYYDESWRTSNFLGHSVKKFHRTMTSYINTLIQEGFTIEAVTEVIPPKDWVALDERNQDEMRRPMMLIIKAKKQADI